MGNRFVVRLKSNARAIYVLKERRNAELGKEKDILNGMRNHVTQHLRDSHVYVYLS